MAKVITPLNLGGFHVRLLSSSKPVSRHCKMSLLSCDTHCPTLYAYILSQLIPALSQKKCCWRAKVEGAIDMHLGQIPQRAEWKLNNGTHCSATSKHIHINSGICSLIASSLTPHLTLLILLPFSGIFTSHWEATRTLVRTSSPTDASHL
jgi:hypothetical protein